MPANWARYLPSAGSSGITEIRGFQEGTPAAPDSVGTIGSLGEERAHLVLSQIWPMLLVWRSAGRTPDRILLNRTKRELPAVGRLEMSEVVCLPPPVPTGRESPPAYPARSSTGTVIEARPEGAIVVAPEGADAGHRPGSESPRQLKRQAFLGTGLRLGQQLPPASRKTLRITLQVTEASCHTSLICTDGTARRLSA